jgi:hypothetical protein
MMAYLFSFVFIPRDTWGESQETRILPSYYMGYQPHRGAVPSIPRLPPGWPLLWHAPGILLHKMNLSKKSKKVFSRPISTWKIAYTDDKCEFVCFSKIGLQSTKCLESAILAICFFPNRFHNATRTTPNVTVKKKSSECMYHGFRDLKFLYMDWRVPLATKSRGGV